MKNIYYSLLLLFLLSPNSTNAQRMDTPGNQWTFSGIGFGGPYFSTQKIGEDTLINGLEYHKMYQSFTGDAPWNLLNRYIRQDSTDKVYYKSGNEEEVLIFDFNFAVNDSFFVEYFGFECPLVVEAIDSVTLNNGSIRKRLRVTLYGTVDNLTDYWIMGIGSTQFSSFSYGDLCAIDGGTSLACFFENDELIYPESSAGCFTNNIEEILDQLNIQIYPNPVSDQLTILDQDQQLTNFELLDLTGKLIKRGPIEMVDQVVSLQNVQPGMYLLMLHTKTGAKLGKKILKYTE